MAENLKIAAGLVIEVPESAFEQAVAAWYGTLARAKNVKVGARVTIRVLAQPRENENV